MSLSWVGRLLRGARAGERHALPNHPVVRVAPQTIALTSEWFANGHPMPVSAAGVGLGGNRSPPLFWRGVPAATVEIALAMEDLDAPIPRPFVHLLAFGLSADRLRVDEGELTSPSPNLRFGRNTSGDQGYRGPRPFPGHGPHRYAIYLLALNRTMAFSSPPTLTAFLTHTRGSIIGFGQLVGTYERP